MSENLYFYGRISKQGEHYNIHIPKDVKPVLKHLHKKSIRVTVEVVVVEE